MRSRYHVGSCLALGVTLACATSAGAQTLSLRAAVDSAFEHHPSITRSRAEEVSAEQGLAAASATRFPALEAEYGIQRFEEPMVTTPIHAFDPNLAPSFDETLVQGSLGLRYTLLDWGGRRAGVAAADAAVGLAGAGARATRMRLIERVADAYLRLRAARAMDEAQQARLVALDAEHARARQAFDAGTAAEVEVLRASVAAQDARASRTSTTAALRFAARELARLTGIDESTVADAELDELGATTSVTGGAPSPEVGPDNGAELRSPAFEAARRRADIAEARVLGERSTRLPRLDLAGALHDYGTLSDGHVFEWQAGVRLSWSLFDGGARGSRVRSAQADLLAAESDCESAELDVQEAIDAARTAIESADARAGALASSVDQWEDLVRIETLALEAGAGTQQDLLEAQAGLFQARAGLAEADRDAVLARLRLASARGVLTRAWLTELTGGNE